jgi:uncharacterized protein (DUF1697 family)
MMRRLNMPGTHVALIRGINVGRAKRVAMGDLRDLFGALGYRDVRTVLNSGNVVFSAGNEKTERIAERVQRAMLDRLGVAARVLVLTRTEYATVIEENGLGVVASDPTRLLVSFCTDAARLKALAPLARRDWKPEAISLGRMAAYAWTPRGVLESDLLEAMGGVLGDSTTARNWATATRIQQLLEPETEASAPERRPKAGSRPRTRAGRPRR